jgi:hypothetical protein
MYAAKSKFVSCRCKIRDNGGKRGYAVFGNNLKSGQWQGCSRCGCFSRDIRWDGNPGCGRPLPQRPIIAGNSDRELLLRKVL